MSPENQWLEDVFPIEIISPFLGNTLVFGGVRSLKILLFVTEGIPCDSQGERANGRQGFSTYFPIRNQELFGTPEFFKITG